MHYMSETPEELTAAAEAASPQDTSSPNPDLQFRYDLAFPTFNDEMLQRLQSYGQVEAVAEGILLYTYGDRDSDMFVVLSGKLNLLNSQRTVAWLAPRRKAGCCVSRERTCGY
jgi:hypothetical protein